MAKKTPAKKKTAAAAKTKKKAATPQAAPKLTGMWKILEQKKMQQKQLEQNQGRSDFGPGHSFHARERDPRTVKFAGPRRKVG